MSTGIFSSQLFKALLFLGLAIGVIVFMGKMKPPKLDNTIALTAQKIDDSCPFQVDSFMRLDSVYPIGIMRLNFEFTDQHILPEDSVSKIERLNLFSHDFMISNPQYKHFFKNDITLDLIYNDLEGERIYSSLWTPHIWNQVMILDNE